MGRLSINLALSVLVISIAAVTAFAGDPSPRKKVLITYFEPFGGAATNSSETVAKQIAADSRLGVDIELCRLPVVYDVSGDEARKCFEKISPKPDYVISLGEGDCTLRFETAADNRDSTPEGPDNSGEIRTYKVINSNEPASTAMTFPIDEILCGSQLSKTEQSLVILSASPGGFVCNNTAFSLARYFARSAPATRYGFVHVPSHGCRKTEEIDLSSEILKKYIRQAVANDVEKSKLDPPSVFCAGRETFPITLKDVAEKINSLKDIGTKACRAAYLKDAISKRLIFENEEKFQTKSF